jgi:prepilin-type N-terminal cleavage/methylation domain-containing protein
MSPRRQLRVINRLADTSRFHSATGSPRDIRVIGSGTQVTGSLPTDCGSLRASIETAHYHHLLLSPQFTSRAGDRLPYRPCWSNHSANGFTLVEIVIVVAVIALLAALSIPGFLRARQRAQAVKIKNDLRLIDAAVDQYAIETAKKAGDAVAVVDWTAYIKRGSNLYETGEDLLGNEYGAQTVDEAPFVPVETYFELGNVVDDDFWEPFNP